MADYSHKRIGARANIHHWSFCSLNGKLWNPCKYGRTTALILVLLCYSPAIYLFFFCFHLEICCFTVTKSCLTLCDPMDCSTPGFPVLLYLSEFAQVHVHWVGDAIWPSCPLPPSYPSVWEHYCIYVVTKHRLGSLELEQSSLPSSPAPCLGHTEASLLIILLLWI